MSKVQNRPPCEQKGLNRCQQSYRLQSELKSPSKLKPVRLQNKFRLTEEETFYKTIKYDTGIRNDNENHCD